MDTIDSWTVDRDGITYQIQLVDDQDANQDAAGQGDCYSPSDLAAHAAGDWTFVGVIVTPVIGGRAVDGASDSLWSVEWGTMPAEPEPHQGGQHGETVIGRERIESYPVPDLISEVRGNLARLRVDLGSVNLDG